MADQPALPNLDGLTALANRDGVDIKPTLLRVMTDLYVQKPVHSVEEERHYTELSMRLIDRVDSATRAIVAERLAKYPTAPRSVIARLLRGREPQPQTAPSHTNSPAPNTATSAATLTELSELFLAANAEDRRMILLHLEYGTLAPATALDAARSPETYLGYARGENFASGPAHADVAATYQTPHPLQTNQWGFTGRWIIGAEKSSLAAPGGKITMRFHARDLHLVLGPGENGNPVRFKVLLDGRPPAESRGMDIDAQGNGAVTDQRLYQLLRVNGPVTGHTFVIQFLDSGAQSFAFTFG